MEWRCSSRHANSSWHPAIEFLERLLDFAEAATPSARLERLKRHLAGVGLDESEQLSLFAALLSLELEDQNPHLALTPQRLKEKTQELLVAWLERLARTNPVLFIIEDLHWADPSTLEFLELHVAQSSRLRALTLLSSRPEFEPPWKSQAHHTTITLKRLLTRQIEQMIRERTGLDRVPDALVKQIADRTDGVPLFIEEFTRTLRESGAVDRIKTGGEAVDSDLLDEIPVTLQDLLAARLDRMASDRSVVQMAATLGREFTYQLLQAASGLEDERLQEELEKLTHAGLLFQSGRPPRASYIFKHALIQDAAYSSLLKKKRREFHRRIAESIESQFRGIVESQPELVAHHYREAECLEQALGYWLKAGQRAQALGECRSDQSLSQRPRGPRDLARVGRTRSAGAELPAVAQRQLDECERLCEPRC